jgi:signal transduction histidine kinase
MLAVTHELKSPLAAIKLNLETLEKRSLDAAQQKLLLQRSVTEINRLNDLCNNMLLASQIEGKQYQAIQEKIDFSDLVIQSIQQFTNRFGNRFILNIGNTCFILGDAFLIQLAIHNILDNAVKYAPADSNITVHVHANEQWAFCEITDEGEGIAVEEQQEVFKKFYRIGNEQVRKKKGTGLGLYLTKKIIDQHKGSVYLKEPKEKGCTFIIKLPLV